jgi:hypothetical protein
MGNHQHRPSGRRSGASWTGAGLVGKPGPESDELPDELEVTGEELREAAEKSPEQPGGERGDLGDSGPGED